MHKIYYVSLRRSKWQTLRRHDKRFNTYHHRDVPSYHRIRFLPHGKQDHVFTSVMRKKQYHPNIANTTTFILVACTQSPDTLKSCKDQTTQEGYHGNYEAMTILSDYRKPEKVD